MNSSENKDNSAIAAIPTRDQIPAEARWSVEDLFATSEAWEKAFEQIKKEFPEKVLAFRGHLADSGETMLRFQKVCEEINQKIYRLIGYASTRADEDTANTEAQSRKGRIYSWLTQAGSETAFDDPEILAISDERMEELYREEPQLELYRRSFDKIRSRREHVLSEAEEKLLTGASEIGSAPEDIFGSFVYADLKFPKAVDSEGQEHPVTGGSYISLMHSPDRKLRESAFRSLYDTYEAYRNTLAATLNGHVKQTIFFSRARRYASAMESALNPVEVPVAVYENLIQAVHDNMDAMYRYVDLRKELMKDPELHMYDIYVSLVPGSSRKIPFEQAKQEVLEAMSVYGEEYSRVLASAFEERWMDIYENQGKRSGAYSSFSAVHPLVLLNHKDDLNSEFTLAHEMGHAMHSWLSHHYQPQVYSHYVLFVAEVASTCNEALLMNYLLDRTEDKKERAILLNYFLEQFRTTLYRQTMFAEFEKQIYELAEQGETLTADLLSERYMELNRFYYGENITLDPGIAMEWARIPHFYYNFYVYQYATGFSAAIALSRRILQGGPSAVEDYLNFLKGGCSTDPVSLLKIAGVDMTTPKPVYEALEYFGQLVEEFGQLMKELEE